MSIDTSEMGTLLLVIIMAVVTIATRWGGVFIMSYIPISNRVQQFISAMSGSVLVAIIAPMFIKGDTGAQAALLVTAVGTLVLKKPLLSIAAGIAMAALMRNM
ncbi:AzlD domain-containing protein [Photobacterium sp. 2_MG-2023]|uniref:AzlD family protein n=1 Tax=unclassified Photobacterium TaxID=2628852 RepID=UPI001C483D8D|nr:MULTISPECIES: AzlD domain-containing protein [unclassified Photobacterium]MBV7263434.1 AzlD domain-containing protein [Photobacterium sp. WH24]MDO6582832.1 AzlD domain-containing protein [Photobacterium sp. 2_MG-2023]